MMNTRVYPPHPSCHHRDCCQRRARRVQSPQTGYPRHIRTLSPSLPLAEIHKGYLHINPCKLSYKQLQTFILGGSIVLHEHQTKY